jgi:hypothetical protein
MKMVEEMDLFGWKEKIVQRERDREKEQRVQQE